MKLNKKKTRLHIIILIVISFSVSCNSHDNKKIVTSDTTQSINIPEIEKKEITSKQESKINLALNSLNNGNEDNAIELLYNILSEAKASNNKDIQYKIYKVLGGFYETKGNTTKAINNYKAAHELRINRRDIPSNNLIKAILYEKINKPDSAVYYAKLASTGNDIFVADVAFTLLRNLESERGNYNNALLYQKNVTDLYENIENSISSAAIQQKYKQEQLTNENNKLKIKQKEKDIILLSILIVIILLLAGLYILYLRQKRIRDIRESRIKEELLKNKAYQLEQENLLLKQNEEISRLREKESNLRESLIRRINLFKKLPSISGIDSSDNNSDESANKKILFTQAEWNELFRGIDEVYPGFHLRLKQNFPKLDDEDLKFCCLVKINVNLQDLSDIYCLSKAAITKKKYRIKKDKLGICDATSSLDDCLKEL